MSGVAGLLNVPETDEQRAVWLSLHMSHHRDINRVIYQITKIALPEYILDPLDVDNPSSWGDQHQSLHTEMDAILGIKGFDIQEVDWKDSGKLGSWIQLHFNEHYQAANILEIG